ncbi:MAG: PASTA domain-containing protein [Solirubrobacteraceae bacterium]|nr:PASTA domain-containing protein [Solirubrobacteraceae bacterium]
MTRVTTDQAGALAQLLRRGGPVSTPDCGAVCTDLWLQEHRPIPNQPTSKALHAELVTLRRKTGVLPGIKSVAAPAFRAAGQGLALYGAWTIGNFIGQEIYSSFLGPELAISADHAWVPYDAQARYAGDTIVESTATGTITAPEDGYVVRWAPEGGGSPVTMPTWTEYEDEDCASGTWYRNPQGIQYAFGSGSWSGSAMCADGWHDETGYVNYVGYTFYPAKLTAQPSPSADTVSSGHAPPPLSEVQTDAAEEIAAHPQTYGNIVNWVDSVSGGDSSNPLITLVDMPDCVGLAYADCTDLLESRDLVPVPTTVTGPAINHELPAGAVVDTVPDAGTQVESGSEVQVKRNPSSMPVTIPSPLADETYADYMTRLAYLGLVGHLVVLEPEFIDPSKPADAIVAVIPAPGTRVSTGTTVTIKVNPGDAATPTGPGPGGFDAPAVPAVDFAPLMEEVPTDRFPFAVPSWILGALGGWSGSGGCPSWDFEFVSYDRHVTLDMCILQPGVDIVRPVIGFGGLLACMWFFMGAAMGFGGRGSDD